MAEFNIGGLEPAGLLPECSFLAFEPSFLTRYVKLHVGMYFTDILIDEETAIY
jgi:hypothetical protein